MDVQNLQDLFLLLALEVVSKSRTVSLMN